METYFGPDMKIWFPISLGFNCHAKKFIEMLCEADGRLYPRLPFDWIGTSMPAVYELVTTKFDGFLDPEKLVVRRRFSDKEDAYLTQTDLNIVFPHDFRTNEYSTATIQKVRDDYRRRIDRFYSVLASGPLLFLRIEMEECAARIEYETTASLADEYSALQRFSCWAQSQGLRFFILHFTQTRDSGFDKDFQIINLGFKKEKDTEIVSAYHLDRILKEHADFLRACFATVHFQHRFST